MTPSTPKKLSSATSSASPSSQRQLMLALTALRRHGPLVIVSSLIMVAGLATIVMMTFKPKYEAMTYLHVIQNPDYSQIIPERNQVKTDAKSELAPIVSEIVLREVLVDENVQRQPSFSKGTMTTKELRKMLRYQSAGGQERYELIATSPFPAEAVAVVSKATEVFLDEFRDYRETRLEKLSDRDNRETRLGQLSEKLSQEIKATSQKIDEVNRELGEMLQNMQGSSPDSAQYDPEGQLLKDLKKSRTEKELQLKVLVERDAKMLQSRLDQRNFPIEDAELTNRVQQSPEVVALRQRIDESKRQRGARSDRGAGHPDVLRAESQIALDERKLEDLTTSLRAQAQESWIAENVRSTTARLNAIDDEIQNLKMEIEYYDDKIAKQYAVISSASREKTKLSMSQADLENLRVEHSRLVEAENAIRLRGMSLPFQISQINLDVVVPTEPVERYPFKLLGISVLAGLGIPFALAFLWELRVNRVTSR